MEGRDLRTEKHFFTLLQKTLLAAVLLSACFHSAADQLSHTITNVHADIIYVHFVDLMSSSWMCSYD